MTSHALGGIFLRIARHYEFPANRMNLRLQAATISRTGE